MLPDLMEQMNGLLGLLIQTKLTDVGGRPFWKWTKNGIFLSNQLTNTSPEWYW